MQGVQVWSLIGELRSHMPHAQKYIKTKWYCNKFSKYFNKWSSLKKENLWIQNQKHKPQQQKNQYSAANAHHPIWDFQNIFEAPFPTPLLLLRALGAIFCVMPGPALRAATLHSSFPPWPAEGYWGLSWLERPAHWPPAPRWQPQISAQRALTAMANLYPPVLYQILCWNACKHPFP